MQNETALSLFRTFNGYPSQKEGLYAGLLLDHFQSKEISLSTLRYMQNRQNIPVGALIHNTLMRKTGKLSVSDLEFIVRSLYSKPDAEGAEFEAYTGSPEQNRVIDQSLTIFNAGAFFVGEGAMAKLELPSGFFENVTNNLRNIPIAIIGTGPAGVLIGSALRAAGFRNITTFDKHNSTVGIWKQPNVRDGTKNNPRTLSFGAVSSLPVALGDGTKDGYQVPEFITAIGRRYDIYNHRKQAVKKIEASNDDYKHIVYYEQDKQEAFAEFPIVINCLGTGKPRNFSDSERMTLEGKAKRPLAIRWQQQLSPEQVDGKSFAFIGLGNSTAEMISQLHERMNAGYNCDYKIFTHYPEESVFNPNDEVFNDDKRYRVFRDLNKPDLTSYQGDLPRARQDYFRALREDRIIAGVTRWSSRDYGDGTKVISTSDGESYTYDSLYALIGYKQDTDLLESNFSLNCNEGYPASDYDGEFRDADDVLLKGYFGLGAMMDSPHDPNSVVLPGMMFRIPDMVFSIICRAAEYAAKVDEKENANVAQHNKNVDDELDGNGEFIDIDD